MPSRGLKYSDQIKALKEQGLLVHEIAARIGISRSIVARNLSPSRSGSREENKLQKLLLKTGLNCLNQLILAVEVQNEYLAQEYIKQQLGKSTLTCAGIGSIMRGVEKTVQVAQALLGENFEALQKPPKPPGVAEAKRRLQEVTAKHARQPKEVV